MAMLVLAIYALYGVVFGAAMVARDRDQGTLEVELSLPVPAWTHGASRWIAASLVLASWMVLGVAAFVAWIGVEDPGAVVRIGLAAATGAVALGLGSVGRAGLKVGFASSLAAGLTAASALFGLGYAAPDIGVHLPLGSIVAGGDGWTPLAVSAALGVAAVALFALRTARP
jgi:ABC-type transport system involved in multi-copper enzyme maturation permease subunit